jgi:putative transposase
MPSKYRIRNYKKNSYYHIYNKGLGKSKIFLDEEDYQKFLYYLETYLSQNPSLDLPKRLLSKNLSLEVSLISFVLFPDHFHLILYQKSQNGISKLLKQVINGYTYYFNTKYENSGSIFAGKFKSAQIPKANLIQLAHYLHSHPGILWLADNL